MDWQEQDLEYSHLGPEPGSLSSLLLQTIFSIQKEIKM